MNNYPCANSTCPNMVNKAGAYCPDCQKREKAAGQWIRELVTDAEAERRRRKIEQDNKHKRGEE